MTKNIFRHLLPILMLIAAAASLMAQSTVTGGINGTITDPQGGVVPNATITVTSMETNAVVTVQSNSAGGYRVTNLQPGKYRIETTVAGFAPVRTENIVVEVSQITNVDIPLSLGTATAVVDVTAEAPVINTNDSSHTTNINQTSINELPINGRRASNFVLLTPGVAPDGNFGLISFRGISGLLNNSTVDGGDNNQAFFSEERGRTRINYSISQDAVREFSVNTSNYSAEFGRSAGGVVNTVTKSGTNDFHGSVFYYLRDNKWGARNAFGFQGILNSAGQSQTIGIKPKDERHQFGGSIGGPIVKDKLFFFFSYDQQKRDFPGIAAPASPSFLNPITVVAPSGNRVCSMPGMGQVVTNVPAEVLFCRGVTQAQTDEGLAYLRGLTGEVPRKGDQTLYLPKIDWVINQNHTLSGVFNRLRWDSPAGVQTQAVVSRGRASFGNDLVSIDTLNLRLNSSLSSTTINEARFQYSKDLEQQIAQPADSTEPMTANGFSPSIAIQTATGITIGKPNFLDRVAYPEEKRWQIADTVTMNRGRHTIKFGGDFNHVSDLLDNLFQNAGAYTYNNLHDFLTDRAIPTAKNYARFNQGFGPTAFKFSTNDYNFFAQDDFRITPELTVNIGLRYEYQQLASPQIPNAFEPRTARFPSDKNNFGPRVGFAYAWGGKTNTVLRGGYGIYYGRIINSTLSNAITNTGVAEGQRQFEFQPSTPGSPTLPNVFSEAPGGSGTRPDIVIFADELNNPMIHQADMILEREIARNLVVSISGLLSVGRSLPTFVDVNLFPANAVRRFTFSGGPFAGQTLDLNVNTGSARPNTNFGRITEIRNTLKSEYYAMVLQANKRFSHGVQFQASYTFSKSLDNGQGSQTFSSPNVPLNPFDYSLEHGTSNFDVPHRIVASMVYAPGKLFGLGGSSGFGRAIFGGWTLAPIVTFQSGFVYSAGYSGNLSNVGGPGGTSTGIFGVGGANRLPNVERNSFRSPRLINIDLRVSRRFRITETMNFEILVEAFNLLNHTNVTEVASRLYSLGGTANSQVLTFDPTFGNPTAAGNSIFRERQVQVAARFQF